MSYLPSNPNANLLDAFKANPDIARPLHDFAEALMRGDSPFTAAERELIAARVSHANGCAFCRDSHAAAARGLGGDAQALQDAIEAPVPAGVSEAMRPVLAYVDKLNRAPAEVSRADVDAILQAGWDERAVHHAALVCGFFNLMNRWVEGLGIESDPDVVAMAGRQLSAEGYAFINRMLAGGGAA